MPKIIRNSGINAEDGVERKKSIKNSTLRYAFSLLPSSTPSGTPITAAIMKAWQVRQTVTPKSFSKGPPARPLIKAPKVSRGGGNKMGLMKPRRTAKSHTMNKNTGPMKGNSLSHAGAFTAAGTGSPTGGAQGWAVGLELGDDVLITISLCRAWTQPSNARRRRPSQRTGQRIFGSGRCRPA